MPVREMAPERSAEHRTLVDELSLEWKTSQSQSGEPLILVERDQKGRPARVHVVWSKWQSIDRGERSEIIVEAAENALSQDDAMNISIAMGMTPDEAKAWGVKY